VLRSFWSRLLKYIGEKVSLVIESTFGFGEEYWQDHHGKMEAAVARAIACSLH